MISLVFSACLLSGDHSCQSISVQLDNKATISSCLSTAHQRALDWQAKHATYMVVGWHCADLTAAPKPSGLPDGVGGGSSGGDSSGDSSSGGSGDK